MTSELSFEVELLAHGEPGETLVVGLAHPGMAGLSAADYLVKHLDYDRTGRRSTTSSRSRRVTFTHAGSRARTSARSPGDSSMG